MPETDDDGNLVGDNYRPIVREDVEEPKVTVTELRASAEFLGIETKGMKKADIEAAIAAKQAESTEESA